MGWGAGNIGGGSGGGLNFKVVGNPQPVNPKENTIWLNTDVKITGYSFAAEQPENLQPGEVWISTGTSSTIAFDALKKNTLMVYPLSAKQMGQDGVLVDVTAKSWQNGEWVDLWEGTLYDSGNEYEFITGGWTTSGFTYGTSTLSANACVKNSDHIAMNKSTNNVCAAGFENAIDLTNYSVIEVTYTNTLLYSNKGIQFHISTTKDLSTNRVARLIATAAVDTKKTETLSVANLSGKHYIGSTSTNSQSGNIHKIILKK